MRKVYVARSRNPVQDEIGRGSAFLNNSQALTIRSQSAYAVIRLSMKGWAGGMDNPISERTPLVIAAEINMITCQTKKILLAGAIEIGRRLQEAKDLVKHGEWENWLAESVSYSRRTAERLIKLYKEYG